MRLRWVILNLFLHRFEITNPFSHLFPQYELQWKNGLPFFNNAKLKAFTTQSEVKFETSLIQRQLTLIIFWHLMDTDLFLVNDLKN